ncbi:MAG: hypothetical protein E7193_02265 [Erysipelotrichaceae bacterium]|nr:hypothetical protein [Erysipelotrichaceae bacterium]
MTTTIRIRKTLKGELNGRLLFFIDRPDAESEEKNLYARRGLDGSPVFGVTFYGLQAGDEIILEEQENNIIGFPFDYKDIPKGKLNVQAFFIRYHKYVRGDGHIIWGMQDNGGGCNYAVTPYNLYSKVYTVDWGNEDITMDLKYEIKPERKLNEGEVLSQNNYDDKGLLRYFKMRSDLLSQFWGEDTYIGANVLLPANYDPKKKYPVLYWQGHWPKDTPAFRYGLELREAEQGVTAYWDSGKAPQFIAVNIRDANMYFDDSYRVNSANLGPYGDALTKEFIPAIEKEFGGLGTTEGRLLAGGSTGGWESMALQLFYPDVFGGAWPACCDGMDFHAFQLVDMYNDENVYEISHNWRHAERPGMRDVKGNVIWTMREENRYELALGGDLAHGMGQMGIFHACYSPCGEDGYPVYSYDPVTGKINRDVVEYWEQNYDLGAYVERNHEWLMPKIRGKIHLRDGDMDNFYLNLGHYILTDILEKYDYQGYSKMFARQGHSFCMTMIELIEEMGEYLVKTVPGYKWKSTWTEEDLRKVLEQKQEQVNS